MPHHSIAGPINKLLAAGFKVAICDQLEDPKMAKGIVKRGVTRILTPGMVYDADTLDGTKSHYIASLDSDSLSFVDTTTGEAFFFQNKDNKSLLGLLDVLPVAEIVLAGSFQQAGLPTNLLVSRHDDVLDHELTQGAPASAARLLSYFYSFWC